MQIHNPEAGSMVWGMLGAGKLYLGPEPFTPHYIRFLYWATDAYTFEEILGFYFEDTVLGAGKLFCPDSKPAFFDSRSELINYYADQQMALSTLHLQIAARLRRLLLNG